MSLSRCKSCNMKKNVAFLSVLLFLLSCANRFEEPEKVKEIHLYENQAYIAVPNAIECDENVLVLQSRLNLSIINIVKFDSTGVIDNEMIDFGDELYGYFMFLKNEDTIVYFPLTDETNSLQLLNRKGLACDEIDLDPAVAAMNPAIGLKGIGNQVFIGNSSMEYNVAYADERAMYYESVSPVCSVDLNDGGVHVFGEFPESYKKNNGNFYDWFPVICPLDDDCCIMSFARDDSIYFYENGIKKESFLCKSKYIDGFAPMDDTKAFDMGYCRNYILSQPKYSGLIYDSYANDYYRVAEHFRKVGNNGRYAEDHDPTWSIIVMDSSFTVKKEYCFKNDEYDSRLVLPGKEGVYILKNSKNDKRLTLTLFKF